MMQPQNSTNVGKFGKIALELGMVDIHQIQECLSIQMDYERSGREIPKLGTLLLAKGYLNSAQVKEILELQKEGRQKAEDQSARNLMEEYQPGAVIFREGDRTSQDMFLIQQGTVELKKRGVPLMDRCGEGSFFGITSCLLKTPRNATAVAKTACRVYRIPAQKAQDFFRAKPAMAVRLATLLAESLFSLKNKFVESQLALRHSTAPSPKKFDDEAQEALPEGMSIFDLPVASATLPTAGPTPPRPVKIHPPVRPPVARDLPDPLAGVDLSGPAGGKHVVAPVKISLPARSPLAGSPSPALERGPSRMPGSQAASEGRAGKADAAVEKPALVLKSGLASSGEADVEEAPPAKDINVRAPNVVAAPERTVAAAEDADSAGGEGEQMPEAPDLLGDGVKPNEDIPEDERDVEPDPAEELFSEGEVPPAPSAEGADIKTLSPETLPDYVKGLAVQAFPKEIREAVQVRVDLLAEAEKLEDLRQKMEMERADDLPESVKNELARQRREVQRIPPYDALKTGLDKLEQTLRGEGMPGAKGPDPLLRQALEWAHQQKKIFLQRSKTTLPTLRVCAAHAVREPLYGIFQSNDAGAENLFGWGVYGLALRDLAQQQTARLKQLRAELEATAEEGKSKGFLGFGRRTSEEATAKRQRLEQEEKSCRLQILCANRELGLVEKPMVDEFWSIYAEAGQLLVKGAFPAEEVFLRAFLRWGALGFSANWLPAEIGAHLLADCASGPEEPVFNMDRTHLYYSDEALVLISRGLLGPTPNEDLELNQRNSPLWKADRAWRRIINCRMQEGILGDIMGRLQKETAEIRAEQADKEKELEHALSRAHDKEKKRLVSQLRHTIQNCKVKAGRLERICEKLEKERLPRNREDRESALQLLQDLQLTFSPADLAAHELRCTRRNARLVAKLKEPFLPFTLQERFKPAAGCVNDRTSALRQLQEAEALDPLVFREPLIPSAKKMHRILIRTSPVVLIAPAGGILGFMQGPRAGVESGRLVLPGYVERAGMREEILWNLLADFRYDTSKASAGMDLMNSDTLVAAYAQVRWNLRKRDRELRQKAAIYMEENERTNWRRHYALYMKSALDSGKLLFYKCPELYELIINRYVDLPGGCEILRR